MYTSRLRVQHHSLLACKNHTKSVTSAPENPRLGVPRPGSEPYSRTRSSAAWRMQRVSDAAVVTAGLRAHRHWRWWERRPARGSSGRARRSQADIGWCFGSGGLGRAAGSMHRSDRLNSQGIPVVTLSFADDSCNPSHTWCARRSREIPCRNCSISESRPQFAR